MSETDPIHEMTEAEAARAGYRMLGAGWPLNVVNEFLRPHGLGLQPILESMPGGRPPETGETS